MVSQPANETISSSHNKVKSKLYYGWVILVVCLLLITIAYGIRFSFGVFFKSLEDYFGWSRALTSGVFSTFMLLGSVFAILGGWVADRYGPRRVFFVMAFFALSGLALTSLANDLWHIFLTYSFMVAAGTGSAYAVSASLATRWFTKRRGLALAIVTSGVGLGSILMAPISAFLIGGYGWRTSFLALGVIAFVVMIPCSLFLRKAPPAAVALSEGKKSDIVPPESRTEPKQFSILQAVKTRNFALFLLIWFFYSYCLFTVMTHIVPNAIDLGITPLQAASILSVMGLANIPMRLFMGFLTDRLGGKPAALISAGLMLVSMLWLTQASSLWMLYAFAAVFGAGYGGLAPPTTTMVGNSFGIRNIGTIMGTLEIGWTSGAAAGPALAGYIFDITGSYYQAFLIGALATFIIIVLVILLKVPGTKTRKLIASVPAGEKAS